MSKAARQARPPADDTAATTPHQLPEGAAAGSGPEVIAGYLKTLPGSPGVYRMLDRDGEVLYVGKARNLKNRVQSYARSAGHTNRIARMIAATAAMEFVVTRTESEALLLEANLIKRFRPRFNVLMRDDKSFPYILISRDQEAPQILKHRGARTRKGDYFGPFASAGAVNRTINTLQRAFLLRSCSDSVYESRTRPCLLYQIKRCAAPCTGEISSAAYGELVDQARRFLSGQTNAVQTQLNELMMAASDRLEFERAAAYRNRLSALAHVQAEQGINPQGVDEADVFAAHQEGGQTCIQVFFFRTGQNWGNRAYYPKAHRTHAVEEVLEAFIAQFYDDKPIARLILVSHRLAGRSLMEEALSTKADRKVTISLPQRGVKHRLVEQAQSNAREALGRRMSESATQKRLLLALGETFSLSRTPRRIEVFDNSHIQGSNAVGAMIVAGEEGLIKGQYRKFNIKDPGIAAGDDFAMMREVLTRRFKRLLKEHGEKQCGPAEEAQEAAEEVGADCPPWPDLLLIDGGRGQTNVATATLNELGVKGVDVIGVAKGPDRDAGREHFYLAGRDAFMLEPRDPVLYFVQRLRDEAHRFAIGTHRARRKKDIAANPLDEIDGIGPTRKRALLRHFGSAKAVSQAGVADLKSVEGISAAMAQAIYDHFHDCDG